MRWPGVVCSEVFYFFKGLRMRFHRTKQSIDLENRLAAGHPGDIITPEMVKSIVGLSADSSRDAGWRLLASVIIKVERSVGIFWRWDRIQKHWKCLTDSEKPAEMTSRTKKMQSQAKRNSRISNSIDYDKLPEPLKREAVINHMVSAAVGICTSTKSRKALTALASSKPVPINEHTLLRLFVVQEQAD